MFRIEASGSNRSGRYCDGMTRRDFVQLGIAGMASVGLPTLLRAKESSSQAGAPAKDTAVAVVANTLDPPVQEAPFSKEVPLITPVITVSPAIDPSAPSTVPRTGNDVPSEASGRPILKQPISVRAASPPLILGERVFMEANSVVTERVVEDDGRAVVYRKVVHTSGQVFHFKDGLAVPERVWNERFAP